MANRAVTQRPSTDEYPESVQPYIRLVPAGSIVDAAREAGRSFCRLLGTVSEQRSLHRYEEGKWSVRQMVSHVTDMERVLAYRAWWFARGLPGELPSVDEERSAAAAGADASELAGHVREFEAVRAATTLLLDGLPDDSWGRTGTAGGHRITVRALAHMIVGHQLHHARILKERYLNG